MVELATRANAAHKAMEAAEAAIEEGEVAEAAARDLSNKLDALDMKTFITSRFRRQDASTTVTAYHNARKAAKASIAEAESIKEAAEDVSNKLNNLDMNSFITSQFRRQDASTIGTNNATPVNCDDLKSTMIDLTNVMDYDPAKATDIVIILTSLDPSYLSPGCSSSDLSELHNAKNAAKDNADAVVTSQADFISAKTDELNALVLLILALNRQISAAGGTTIHLGTTAPEGQPSLWTIIINIGHI